MNDKPLQATVLPFNPRTSMHVKFRRRMESAYKSLFYISIIINFFLIILMALMSKNG